MHIPRTFTVLLLAVVMLPACSQHTDPATRIADTTTNILDTAKVLVRTVTAAELTMTPEQRKQSGPTLDTFYLTSYQVGVRGEQVADLLVAYKSATDAAAQGTLLERVEAILPVLERDLAKLTGITIPGASTEIVTLVQNLAALTNTLKAEAERLRAARQTPAALLYLPPTPPPAAAGGGLLTLTALRAV